MELETLNKLYLELSQITTATTAREILLKKQLAEAQKDAERYRWLRERWGRLAESYTDDGGRMAHLRVMSDRDVDAGLGWDVEASSLDAAIDAAKGDSNA